MKDSSTSSGSNSTGLRPKSSMEPHLIPADSPELVRYRGAQPGIRAILRTVAGIRWLQPGNTEPTTWLRGIQEHLAGLDKGSDLNLPDPLTIRLVTGYWTVLADTFRDAGRDIRSWAPDGKWCEAVGRTYAAAQDHIRRSPALMELIGPPLWPMDGEPNICGLLLVAGGSLLLDVEDQRNQDCAWALMAQVENHVWSCLTVEIVQQANTSGNPLFPLLRTYALGYYPIGFARDRFLVFGYSGQESEFEATIEGLDRG
jgi:hypothetical protein